VQIIGKFVVVRHEFVRRMLAAHATRETPHSSMHDNLNQ
jgi:hypothetical protein